MTGVRDMTRRTYSDRNPIQCIFQNLGFNSIKILNFSGYKEVTQREDYTDFASSKSFSCASAFRLNTLFIMQHLDEPLGLVLIITYPTPLHNLVF